MKIKKKKQLNLPQLIEHIWENEKRGFSVISNMNSVVALESNGKLNIQPNIFYREETFTVEVEEEITEDTEFKRLVCINDNDKTVPFSNFTIRELKDIGVKEFHAYIDGEFKLIWRDGKLVV